MGQGITMGSSSTRKAPSLHHALKSFTHSEKRSQQTVNGLKGEGTGRLTWLLGHPHAGLGRSGMRRASYLATMR